MLRSMYFSLIQFTLKVLDAGEQGGSMRLLPMLQRGIDEGVDTEQKI